MVKDRIDIFLVNVIYTWRWQHVIRVDKEKIILAPKRRQEIFKYKYAAQKQRIYAVFSNKKHKKYHKTLFKYREGGHAVGSGRVATIIEWL